MSPYWSTFTQMRLESSPASKVKYLVGHCQHNLATGEPIVCEHHMHVIRRKNNRYRFITALVADLLIFEHELFLQSPISLQAPSLSPFYTLSFYPFSWYHQNCMIYYSFNLCLAFLWTSPEQEAGSISVTLLIFFCDTLLLFNAYPTRHHCYNLPHDR